MCRCEDRPCCGHDLEERYDDLYREERMRYDSDEDDFYDEDDEDSEDEDNDYWMAEDAALEESLFGDC